MPPPPYKGGGRFPPKGRKKACVPERRNRTTNGERVFQSKANGLTKIDAVFSTPGGEKGF